MKHWKRFTEASEPVDEASLRRIVALQHYASLDLEDLTLPRAQRRNEDNFVGVSGGICEQLILDACRGTYVIAGERFDFVESLHNSGISLESIEALEMQRLQAAFADRLVLAIGHCLGGKCLNGTTGIVLIQAVTTAMSQSGMANLERACDDVQVVVCGGDQTLCYELQLANRAEADISAWQVELSVRKFGFDQCILYEANCVEAQEPVACSVKSFISKRCRLRVLTRDSGESLEVDVLEATSVVSIVDNLGRPLATLTTLLQKPKRPNSCVQRMIITLRLFALFVLMACGSCGSCRVVTRILRSASARLRSTFVGWHRGKP